MVRLSIDQIGQCSISDWSRKRKRNCQTRIESLCLASEFLLSDWFAQTSQVGQFLFLSAEPETTQDDELGRLSRIARLAETDDGNAKKVQKTG